MSGTSGHAPRISVGIPVYNGEPFLADALACLSRQDVTDAEFIICDNASTDATARIAAEFAARDPRFRIVRQATTKPAEENFSDVLHQAHGQFFCWRAADDLSSDNFLAELARLLDADPSLVLVTCRIDNIRGAEPAVIRSTPMPVRSPGSHDLWHTLKLSHTIRAAAFYGLWRRDDLIRRYAGVTANFPYLFAQDVLLLLDPILQGRVATTNNAVFVQRLKDKGGNASAAPFYAIRDAAQQAKARAKFLGLALGHVRALDASRFRKLILGFATRLYVERRVFRLWRIRLAEVRARITRHL
ncbi:MAG: glycosyltransferase family 2 protein [Bosea sp. (in: a-proteobacteria)]